jgi:mycofactocin precursor
MTQQTLTQVPAAPEAPEIPAEPRPGEHDAGEALVAGERLVEEVSIDGMCGVY